MGILLNINDAYNLDESNKMLQKKKKKSEKLTACVVLIFFEYDFDGESVRILGKSSSILGY